MSFHKKCSGSHLAGCPCKVSSFLGLSASRNETARIRKKTSWWTLTLLSIPHIVASQGRNRLKIQVWKMSFPGGEDEVQSA